MARVGQVKSPSTGSESVRLTDRVSLGVLAEVLPRDLLDEVLTETGTDTRSENDCFPRM